jgi:hypothetical protein
VKSIGVSPHRACPGIWNHFLFPLEFQAEREVSNADVTALEESKIVVRIPRPKHELRGGAGAATDGGKNTRIGSSQRKTEAAMEAYKKIVCGIPGENKGRRKIM